MFAKLNARDEEWQQLVRETPAKIRPAGQVWPVTVNRVTSDQSAVRLGLDAFVNSLSFDSQQLKNA